LHLLKEPENTFFCAYMSVISPNNELVIDIFNNKKDNFKIFKKRLTQTFELYTCKLEKNALFYFIIMINNKNVLSCYLLFSNKSSLTSCFL